jgi:hypothetical protein
MQKITAILESTEVTRYLMIAKRYARYIKSAREIRIPGIICDHATIVNVFSAAAIEAALNLYIAIPLLTIKKRQIRAFYGTLLTKHLRLSVRKKISFAKSFSKEMKEEAKLLGEVNAIFDSRNSYLHASPIYSESSGIDFSKLRGVSFKGFKTYPQLTVSSFSSQDVIESLRHYSIAVKFIKLLDKSNSERLQLITEG